MMQFALKCAAVGFPVDASQSSIFVTDLAFTVLPARTLVKVLAFPLELHVNLWPSWLRF